MVRERKGRANDVFRNLRVYDFSMWTTEELKRELAQCGSPPVNDRKYAAVRARVEWFNRKLYLIREIAERGGLTRDHYSCTLVSQANGAGNEPMSEWVGTHTRRARISLF